MLISTIKSTPVFRKRIQIQAKFHRASLAWWACASRFANLALLLACIGVYGVLSYMMGRRIPEIGVRIALGASRRNVMELVFRQSLAMILFGTGAGVCAAFACSRVLEHSVTGMTEADPPTFVIMTSVLIAAALFASFIPARRASRVDPMRALRQE